MSCLSLRLLSERKSDFCTNTTVLDFNQTNRCRFAAMLAADFEEQIALIGALELPSHLNRGWKFALRFVLIRRGTSHMPSTGVCIMSLLSVLWEKQTAESQND